MLRGIRAAAEATPRVEPGGAPELGDPGLKIR
jgi:hypothetical protein